MSQERSFAVGSQNPAKIRAVGYAVRQFWPDATVFGVEVSSGVKGQPMTDQETKSGASIRAVEALKEARSADFGIGLESGIELKRDGLWTFGWVAIVDHKGKMGLAKTIEFRLPPGLARPIKSNMEQGRADSQFFKRDNRGEKGGTIGFLTKGKVKRAEAFSQAVILALTPFLNPQYYK